MKLKFKTLLECLISIRDVGVKPSFGICGNVFEQLQEGLSNVVDLQLDDLFDVWLRERRKNSHYCSIAYPVGGHSEYNNARERGRLWTNPERLELLHWMITKLENPETISTKSELLANQANVLGLGVTDVNLSSSGIEL